MVYVMLKDCKLRQSSCVKTQDSEDYSISHYEWDRSESDSANSVWWLICLLRKLHIGYQIVEYRQGWDEGVTIIIYYKYPAHDV